MGVRMGQLWGFRIEGSDWVFEGVREACREAGVRFELGVDKRRYDLGYGGSSLASRDKHLDCVRPCLI